MTCHEAQGMLSLYLYGELDFAQEESLEEHLAGCGLCEFALAREKRWHTTIAGQVADPSMQLLAGCRSGLRDSIHSMNPKSLGARLRRLASIAVPVSWSPRFAAVCLVVGLSFAAGRWFEKAGMGPEAPVGLQGASEMGVLGPASVRVRYVRPEGDQRVRLVVDQVRRQELTGRPDEETMRRLLIAAVSDPADPGVRVDSIDALKEQSGPDILRVLLTAAQTDANAGVRLKAIDGLRRFAADPQVQTVLASALEHDANPGVRSEAIAALVPYTRDGGLDPDVSQRLGQIARSGQDDYIRMQCVQVLKELKSPAPVY